MVVSRINNTPFASSPSYQVWLNQPSCRALRRSFVGNNGRFLRFHNLELRNNDLLFSDLFSRFKGCFSSSSSRLSSGEYLTLPIPRDDLRTPTDVR